MRTFTDCDACVDAILDQLGKRIVLGTPLGIGKPNALLNALYRRAKADASIQLDLVTALCLNPPLGKSELEERFLAPVRERVWPGYPRLEYVDDLVARRLPPNVRVIEFYMQSGSQLHNPHSQRNYISSNYTHVARDMLGRGVNLLLQAVALREEGGRRRLSLSSNPDVSLPLLPLMRELQRPWLACGQINRELPWLGNHAEVGEEQFHFMVDNPALDHAPFAVPHEPVGTADWAIGVRASSLVRDGGTLQVGIG
ncbi:MAG: acetyl-CoA hydrolase, partial [Nevskia sp.]|nr:acetyl-CoA hydrolase [Nevskia sp.]